jgi:hypothetical protein
MMQRVVVCRFSWVLMAASLLGSWAGMWHSHERENILLACHPLFSRHECGDHERHLPADRIRHCTLCASHAQRFALSPSSDVAFYALTASDCFLPGDSTPLRTGVRFSLAQRGPPAV